MLVFILVYGVIGAAAACGLYFAWDRLGRDHGGHAAPRRPLLASLTGDHVVAASQPPAAITDEPETAGFWPARKPWDSGITAAVPALRNAPNA